jgi:hypothetical protein
LVDGNVHAFGTVTLYIAAFNQTYAKELNGTVLTVAKLNAQPRTIERINQWLKKTCVVLLEGGSFNHHRMAQTALPKLTTAALQPADLARFWRLFDRVISAS